MGDSAEDAALHLHHVERREMVARVSGRAAILKKQALEAAVVALAHRRMDAHIGSDAAQNDGSSWNRVGNFLH